VIFIVLGLHCLVTLGNNYPVTWRHIPEEQKPDAISYLQLRQWVRII